jgi:acetyl esterase/lipase
VALHEWNGAPHAWPLFDGFFPEAREALEDVAAFVRSL